MLAMTFEGKSLDSLNRITKNVGLSSCGETIRQSLQIAEGLQIQARAGFTEMLVRNPETGREKKMRSVQVVGRF